MISIHASRGGSDPAYEREKAERLNFNPRFPWGKRHPLVCGTVQLGDISIHASRGGSDPARQHAALHRKISIHASRGGSDPAHLQTLFKGEISIHASRGGSDDKIPVLKACTPAFQSTLPVGEATSKRRRAGRRFTISIHASRGGSDIFVLGANF